MIEEALLVEAAREVITTSAGVPVTGNGPGRTMAAEFDGLVAMLSFSGSCPGTLALLCPPPLGAALAAGMLGMTPDECEADTVSDAFGELANQIAGTVKRKLAKSSNEITLSCPMVVRGSHVALKALAQPHPVSADLSTDAGMLHVYFWLPA